MTRRRFSTTSMFYGRTVSALESDYREQSMRMDWAFRYHKKICESLIPYPHDHFCFRLPENSVVDGEPATCIAVRKRDVVLTDSNDNRP